MMTPPSRRSRSIRLLALLLGAFVVAGVVGILAGSSSHLARLPGTRLVDSTTTTSSTTAAGTRLPPIIHRPSGLGASGRQVPLVVMLHGGGETPAAMEGTSQMDVIANRYRFIAAYLSSPLPFWKAPSNITYISSMIHQLISSDNVDPSRVYVVGFSLGGYAAFRTACQLSNQVAGIAAVSQVMAPLWKRPCHPTRPLAELSIVGSNDLVALHARRANGVSADQTAAIWRKFNDCSSTSISSTMVGPTVQAIWSNCVDGTSVGEYVVEGGIHAYPHLNAPSGQTIPDYRYNGSLAIWQFLSTHRLNASTPTVNFSSVSVHGSGKNRVLALSVQAGEPLSLQVTLGNGSRRALVKNLKSQKSGRVRFSFRLPSRVSAGRYNLSVKIKDTYGRQLTVTRVYRIPT
jgi:polyhydroxybutyrate depolymerase